MRRRLGVDCLPAGLQEKTAQSDAAHVFLHIHLVLVFGLAPVRRANGAGVDAPAATPQ